jgi:hypothetical protein
LSFLPEPQGHCASCGVPAHAGPAKRGSGWSAPFSEPGRRAAGGGDRAVEDVAWAYPLPDCPCFAGYACFYPEKVDRIAVEGEPAMSEITHERRGLLLSTAAWVGGLPAAAATRPARGFQVEEMPPTSAIGRAYANRCGGSSEHAALIARLQALLANDPAARSMSETCPICGCPIIVSR